MFLVQDVIVIIFQRMCIYPKTELYTETLKTELYTETLLLTTFHFTGVLFNQTRTFMQTYIHTLALTYMRASQ